MAKLPTINDLGRLPGVPSPGVATISPTSIRTPKLRDPNLPRPESVNADMSGSAASIERSADSARTAGANMLKGIGADIERYRAALEIQETKDTATKVIQARADVEIGQIALEDELTRNPETSDTHLAVHAEKSAEIKAAALAKIPPELQEQWSAQFDVVEARHRSNVGAKVRVIHNNKIFADSQGALENYRTSSLSVDATPEIIKANRESSIDAIDALLAAGIIGGPAAQTLKETYINGTAKDRAEIFSISNPEDFSADLRGRGPAFRLSLANRESRGRGDYQALNDLGYAGRWQVGAGRLVDLGFYTKGEKEFFRNSKGRYEWNGEKWSGEIHIPGFTEGKNLVKTLDDFLNNPAAQEFVLEKHLDLMEKEIKENGFDKYIGHTVDNVPITQEGLFFMLQLGGVEGTRAALTGTENRKDKNKTSVLGYALEGARVFPYKDVDPVVLAKFKKDAVNNVQYNDLLVGINDGIIGSEGVDQARQDGWLWENEKIEAAHRAVGAFQTRDVGNRAVRKFGNPESLWDKSDPEDVKMADALIDNGGGRERLGKKDDDYFNGPVVSIVENLGFVPKAVTGPLKAMLRSKDPDTLTWTLSKLDQLERQNPQAFAADLGDDAMGKVSFYRDVVSYGTKNEVAEHLLRSEDPAHATARKEQYEEGLTLAAEVSDENILDSFDPSVFVTGPDESIDPIMNRVLRGEFNRVFARQHGLGDKNAEANSLKIIATKWGETSVGGYRLPPNTRETILGPVSSGSVARRAREQLDIVDAEPPPPGLFNPDRRMMKNPPEKTYNTIENSYEWLTRQALEQIEPMLNEMEAQGYKLIADQDTEALIARGAPPSWGLVVLDKNGMLQAFKDVRITFNRQKELDRMREKYESLHPRVRAIKESEDDPERILKADELVRQRLGM